MSVVSCQLSVVVATSGRAQRTTDHLSRTPRRAITLTEVLISMGILTIGLLGVAALFPVGGYYMQQADIADRGSAIAQSVMNESVTSGMLNPQAWQVMIPAPRVGVYGVWNTGFRADSKYGPSPSPPAPSPPRPGTFTRPYVEALNEALTQPQAASDRAVVGKQFGAAVIIDPMGVAAMAFPDPSKGDQTWNGGASAFPATGFQVMSSFYAGWQQWGSRWPVRRATFRDSRTGWHMGPETAEHYCRAHDDLVTDFPERDDRPASQNWDIERTTKMPLSRQWTGDYSWLVSVVPTTVEARDGIVRNPESNTYNVSVVVFYKRPLPPKPLDLLTSLESSAAGARKTYLDTMGANERAVKASIISTGLNGGEILLTDLEDSTINQSPFDGLKVSQWIMLCGPHPNNNYATTSPGSVQRFALNWYQVLDIDAEELPATQRRIVVRGPRWAWEPGGQYANELCVGIFRGAVAVHSKTLRLENPRSSPITFGGGGSITQTPSKDTLN